MLPDPIDDRGQRRSWSPASLEARLPLTPRVVLDRLITAVLMAIAFIAVTSPFKGSLIRSYVFGGASSWLLWVLSIGIFAVLTLINSRRPRRHIAATRRRLQLEHGRCINCDYALTSIPPDRDGCTVCPECGAAWRLPDYSPLIADELASRDGDGGRPSDRIDEPVTRARR